MSVTYIRPKPSVLIDTVDPVGKPSWGPGKSFFSRNVGKRHIPAMKRLIIDLQEAIKLLEEGENS